MYENQRTEFKGGKTSLLEPKYFKQRNPRVFAEPPPSLFDRAAALRRHASCAPGMRACPPCAPLQRRRPQPLPPALSHSVASGSTSRLLSLDGGESRGGRGDDAEGEQREGGRDSGSNCLESDDGRGGGGDSRPAAVAAAVAAVQGRLTPGRPAPAARWGPRTILYLVRHGGRRSCTWPLARNSASENGMSRVIRDVASQESKSY